MAKWILNASPAFWFISLLLRFYLPSRFCYCINILHAASLPFFAKVYAVFVFVYRIDTTQV